jgi:thiol-disulfide isomerase/thioredoxin
MRSIRCSLTSLLLIGLMRVSAMGQPDPKALPAPSALLELRPKLQGVEYDTPLDQASISACKVETVLNEQKRSVGYALRDAQGKLLRRFVMAHGGARLDRPRLDQWSYYQDGFEVYREEDLDGDRSLDECRWLNAGGTRVALIEKGQIKAWKQISAEEASKVLVQALVLRDDALLETVLATPAELTAAGAPKEIIAKVTALAQKRAEQVGELQQKLVGWNKQIVWNRFDGTFPHVIPADPASGLEKDLVLYENAMVIPGTTGAQENAAKLAFLQVPDLIQLGATWKFIELPRAIDPEKPIVTVVGGIRAMLFSGANDIEPRDEAMDAALKALVDYDVKNTPLLQGVDKKKIAQYHIGRVPVLRGLVKLSKRPEEQLNFNKQIVDSLVAAYRTDQWPQGKKPLDKLVADGGKLGSYAAYCMIDAEFALNNDKPDANILANQKQWMADLEDFLKKFPDADEVAPVLLHLANANEFNAEEKRAREQYGKLVQRYAATDAGKKATGALRRLDLVGQPLVIEGTGIQNERVDSAQSRGKPVLVVFWASWASPVKADLPDLIKAYDKYHPRGFEIVGVNVDNDRADLDAFVKANKLAWPQIFEAGGMDSRLAIDFGIISLPTMFLVDGEGKVVSRNLRIAELEKQLENLLPAKQAGVADRRQ